MSEKFKRDFGTVVKSIEGDDVILGLTLRDALAIISTLPQEQQKHIQEALLEANKKKLTLADAAIIALTAAYEDEKSLDGTERMKRFQLALRINKSGMVKINTEERDKIKKLIYRNFLGSSIAPVCDLLLEGVDPFKIDEEEEEPKLKAI